MEGHEQALKEYIQATNTHDFNNVKRLLSPHAMDDIKVCFANDWYITKN